MGQGGGKYLNNLPNVFSFLEREINNYLLKNGTKENKFFLTPHSQK
jgi:hypothetical protein